MIPFCDFKRELKYKQEAIADVVCALLYSIALVACIVGLVISSLERDILTICWCSLFLPIITYITVLHIYWAVRDYKKYKLVKETNETALDFILLDIAMEKLKLTMLDIAMKKLIEEIEADKKEEKATKTTAKKKTTRKRK